MQRIINGIREFLPLGAREAGVVFMGDVSAKLLTFLITLWMMSLLTAEDYKLYGLFITVLATINQFTDSGIQQSFIRFYSLYKNSDPDRAKAHFQMAIRIKSLLILITAIVLYYGAEFLAVSLLRTPELVMPLKIMTIAIIGGGMMEFILAVLQARQEFIRFTIVRVTEAAIKTGTIYVGILLGAFSLTFVYSAYAAAPVIVAAVGLLAFRALRGAAAYDWKEITREIWSFGKWMMVTSFATMFLMRLDVFMVTPMLADSPAEAGIYIAAARLCTPLIVLVGSVSTVFFPKAMELRTVADMRHYVKRTFIVTLPVTGIGLAYLFVMHLAVPHFFEKYVDALPMFSVLFIGYAWTIIGNPLTMLILSIGRARVATYIALIQLPVTLLSHYLFIGSMGSMGAAISSIIVWFAAGFASLLYIYLHRQEITSAVPDATAEPVSE